MTTQKRSAFTLFQLLFLLALLALLFALLLPAIAKVRLAAARAQSQNNLKQIGLACHGYNDANNNFPPGVDDKGFSAAAYLLPYIEQQNIFQQIDFKKSITDDANKKVAATQIKTFLNPQDPLQEVSKEYGATNYLFCAGSKPDLKDNDGVFFLDSKVKFTQITDGTSNTLMAGETLKGDGAVKATDVHRQHVRLKQADLKNLKDDSGVKDFADDKNIAADRCRSWMDGHFLQGTFTGTRTLNDEKPDVDCGGVGGLSGLRGLNDGVNILMCDGSVRYVTMKVNLATWKLLAGKDDGQPLPADF